MLRRQHWSEKQSEGENAPSTSTTVAVEKSLPKSALRKSKDIKDLEKQVFGGEDEFLKHLKQSHESDDSDLSSDDEKPDEIKIDKSRDLVLETDSKDEKKPAWVDEDDNVEIKIRPSRKITKITGTEEGQTVQGDQYANRLKQYYEKSVGISTPKWADLKKRKRTSSSEGSEDDNDDLMRRTGNYKGNSINLPKETLHFKRICDMTTFHHITIDNKENSLLQNVLFAGFPVETAHFSADGERVIVGSNMYSYFYYYDMLSDKVVKVPKIRSLGEQKLGKFCVSPDGSLLAFAGTFGNIHLLSATTYDYISTLKMNGAVGAMCFSALGQQLYSHGDAGEVYVWDVRRRDCVHKFYDNGCIKGTSVAISPNDTFLACGSDSGVVNLYDTVSATNSTQPRPLKSIMNLTTPATCLSFNCTNEILTLSSSLKQNSVRMFHTASKSTFQNFPNERDKLGNINCFDFSTNSGYFCCGNDKGRALLYRIFHYENY